MMLADLQPLPVEDHRYRFGDVCGGGDRSVADSGLPQFLDVAQHKCGRDEPAPVACALRRRPSGGIARVGGATGNTAATAQIAVPSTVRLFSEPLADRGKVFWAKS